jgi:hypothetical protein
MIQGLLYLDFSTVYVQTNDQTDYSSPFNSKITFLPSTFTVKTADFSKLADNSIVILDDFSFLSGTNTKHIKLEFLHVINYYLRHHKIILFLVIHNLYGTGLLHNILLAPHIIIAYSNLGFYLIKKLQLRLGGNVLDFFNDIEKYNFHFCYINCNKNYIINCIDQLFVNKKTTMFANRQKYIIHNENHVCQVEPINADVNQIENEINLYLQTAYPRNKHLPFLFKIMLAKNLLNSDLFFVNFPNIHVADFCAFINNRFDKKIDKKNDLFKLCQYLQKHHIKFPKIAIKNPLAQKYLT